MIHILMVSDMSRENIFGSSDTPEVRPFSEESRGFCRYARFKVRPKRVHEYSLGSRSVQAIVHSRGLDLA